MVLVLFALGRFTDAAFALLLRDQGDLVGARPLFERALGIREKAFGPDMNHLLRMQLAYDVAKTRERAGDIAIKRYVPA